MPLDILYLGPSKDNNNIKNTWGYYPLPLDILDLISNKDNNNIKSIPGAIIHCHLTYYI